MHTQAVSDSVYPGGTWKFGPGSHREGTSLSVKTQPFYHNQTHPRKPDGTTETQIDCGGRSLVDLHFIPLQFVELLS